MRTILFPSLAFLCVLGAAAPASGQAAATLCKDGSTSAVSGRGACTAHGGVDKAATKQAKKAVKAEQKAEVKSAKAAGTMVTCGDGSSSNPGRGACSRHGGIRVAGSAPAMTPAPAPSMPTPMTPAAPHPTPMPAPRRSTPPMSAPAGAPTPMPAPRSTSTSSPAAAASHRAEDNDPSGALAQCKDGMYSHATNRRGACSRHKGVAKWM